MLIKIIYFLQTLIRRSFFATDCIGSIKRLNREEKIKRRDGEEPNAKSIDLIHSKSKRPHIITPRKKKTEQIHFNLHTILTVKSFIDISKSKPLHKKQKGILISYKLISHLISDLQNLKRRRIRLQKTKISSFIFDN